MRVRELKILRRTRKDMNLRIRSMRARSDDLAHLMIDAKFNPDHYDPSDLVAALTSEVDKQIADLEYWRGQITAVCKRYAVVGGSELEDGVRVR